MKQDVQINRLCNILRRELYRFPEGEKFHSVREIIRNYKTHRGIVDGALDRLEAEKLIRRSSRTGIFSNIPTTSAELKILLFHLDWPSSTIAEWVEQAGKYVETHSRWKLSIRKLSARDLFTRFDVSPYDALVMVLNNHILQDRWNMEWLCRLDRPTVILDAEVGALPFSTVCSNDRFGVMDACRYLYDHGHRTVAYIRTEPASPGISQLADCFLKTSELLGMKAIMIDSHVFYGEFSREKCSSFIQDYLDSHGGSCPFSAVFCESGDPADAIAETFLRNGIRIPEDLSIMTRGTLGASSGVIPLTMIAADFELAIHEVFKGLTVLCKKEVSCFKKLLPMKIIDRGSVARIDPGGMPK